jgi:hypothetical protein
MEEQPEIGETTWRTEVFCQESLLECPSGRRANAEIAARLALSGVVNDMVRSMKDSHISILERFHVIVL